MSVYKPLIFIYPLNSSLQNLKRVKEESAEEEQIEVMECDMVAEAKQLIGSIGPCVCFLSDLKKCAQILQENRKIIKANSIKILLLQNEDLPRKVFLNLQKLGLTELIIEPVSPKSLMFKTNILIKALPTPPQNIDDLEEKKETPLHFKSEEKIKTNNKLAVKEEKEITLNFADKKEPTKDPATSSKGNPFETNQKIKEKEGLALKMDRKSDPKKKNKDLDDHNEFDSPEDFELDDDLFSGIDDIDDHLPKEKKTELHLAPKKLSSSSDKTSELKLTSSKQVLDKESPEESKELTKKETSESGLKLRQVDSKLQESETDLPLENSHSKIKSQEETQIDLQKKSPTDTKKSELEPSRKNLVTEDSENPLNIEKKAELDESKNSLEIKKGTTKKADDNDLNPLDSNQKIEDHDVDLKIDQVSSLKSKDEEEAPDDEIKKLDDIGALNIQSSQEPIQKEAELNLTPKEIGAKEKDKDLGLSAKKIASKEDDLNLAEAEGVKKLGNPDLNLSEGKKKEASIEDNNNDIQKLGTVEDLEIDQQRKKSKEESNLDLLKNNTLKELDEENIENELKAKSLDELNITGGKESKANDKINLEIQNEKHTDQTVSKLEFEGKERKKKKREVNQNWDFGKKAKDSKAEEELSLERKNQEEVLELNKKEKDYDALEEHEYKEGEQKSNAFLKRKDDDAESHIKEAIEEEEVEENQDPFPVDSKGIENAVEILDMILNKNVSKEEILSRSIKNILDLTGGILTFYTYDKEKEEAKLLYNQLEEESPEYEQWKALEELSLEDWVSIQVPTFKDPTFQSESNLFIYPFFEGITRIGLGVIIFNSKIDEEQSSIIELYMEMNRAVYLQNLRDVGTKGSYNKEKKEEGKEKKKGFFSKFFNRAS